MGAMRHGPVRGAGLFVEGGPASAVAEMKVAGVVEAFGEGDHADVVACGYEVLDQRFGMRGGDHPREVVARRNAQLAMFALDRRGGLEHAGVVDAAVVEQNQQGPRGMQQVRVLVVAQGVQAMRERGGIRVEHGKGTGRIQAGACEPTLDAPVHVGDAAGRRQSL